MTNSDFSKIKKAVDFDELYPGRFLKSGEFKGKKITLTIQDVVTDELTDAQQGVKRRGIIMFKETERQLVLNKTNGLCIRGMFGRDLTKWIGKRITLYPMEYQGDTAIRVWGSPDIEKTFDVTVALPRKRPFQMPMHKVNKKPLPESAPPEQEHPVHLSEDDDGPEYDDEGRLI